MNESRLSSRSVEVLHSIVQSFIETGEPVASRTIARRRKDNLSPATIRNIMADLSDLGYLEQPHTSAGRIPTAKGYRHFAQSAVGRHLANSDAERLRDSLSQTPGVEERAEAATHLLTELTRNVGIVAAIPVARQALDRIELVGLPDSRVLMVVVTRDGLVRNQVAHLNEQLLPQDLESIRNYVNMEFAGWTLDQVRKELGRRLLEERAAYDLLLRKLQCLYRQGLMDIGLAPSVYLDGASNLVGLDLHLTRERLRELFKTLEEKERLIEMLDQFLAEAGGELVVQIGLEGAHPALRGFSMIGLRVETSGGVETRMAVLGPMRMNYSRAVSTVVHLGHLLRTLPPQ